MLGTSLLWGQATVKIKLAMARSVTGYFPLVATATKMGRDPARPISSKNGCVCGKH